MPTLPRGLARLLAILAVVMAASSGLAERQGPHLSGAAAQYEFAQLAVTSEYLVGEWYTRNVERGHDIEIFWTVLRDGTLSYKFVVDGLSADGLQGTWSLVGDQLTERWQRPFGLTGVGSATLERIDDNTLRLTIIDNGNADYAGEVRIYRRRGGPQVSRANDGGLGLTG